MSNVYLAINNKKACCENVPHQIFTDEIALASYIREQWDCYLFDGLKKIQSVETTVIEENPKEGDGHTPVSEGVRVQRPVNDPEPERGRRMRKAA